MQGAASDMSDAAFLLVNEIILNDAVKELGMPSVFDEYADFPHIIQRDSELAVTSIAQKNYPDINEEGTEAASNFGYHRGIRKGSTTFHDEH